MIFLQRTFFGNTIETYLVSAAIFIIAVLFSWVVNHILKRYVHAWALKTETKLDDLILRCLFPPLTYLVLLGGLSIAKGQLTLPEKTSLWIDKIILVLGLTLFFTMFMRFFQGIIEFVADGQIKRLEQKAPADLEEQIKNTTRIRKQVREISNLVIGGLAILTILSHLGVNLKAIWTSLGIGGLALALAVQEPLRNLVGRIYIFSTGIFDEGHFIIFSEWAGTVKRISAFRTYLELFSDMTTVSIPNADFVKGAVKTYYGRTAFMYRWDLDVPYDVPPERIQGLIARLRELILSKDEVNKDMCWIYLERLDRYSKVVRVWFQVRLSSWNRSLFYGSKVLQDIQLVFESMGIPFAFPTQTIELKTEDLQKKEAVPVVLPDPDSETPPRSPNS